jgi:hypothetical protein
MAEFDDISRLGRSFDPATVATAIKTKRPPRPRKRGKFIWGPVPWDWLTSAAKLSCTAVLVGLVLWHLAGLHKNRRFRFQYARAAELGLHRNCVYRALCSLERAGLVAVKRGRGRCPVVTILDAPAPDIAPDSEPQPAPNA